MNLSEYLVNQLADLGIHHLFGLNSGPTVRVFDAAARSGRVAPVFCHHEQSAALAAVSYARCRNALGATMVTTGPGGTNALTGVASAWLDSIPCLFLSGQVSSEQSIRGRPLRQVGGQELDIVRMVESITKYAITIESPERLLYHLEKALYFAQEGRPGPVWLDIPVNFQSANIDPARLSTFDSSAERIPNVKTTPTLEELDQCWRLLARARRPLLLVGYGVRLARAERSCAALIESLAIPFVCTWTAADIMPSTHPLNFGRIGFFGQRGANLAVQNCDLIVAVGSHLSPPLTGSLFGAFAREAQRVVVSIDQATLVHSTVRIDLPIAADARAFLEGLRTYAGRPAETRADWQPWRDQCAAYHRYDAVPKQLRERQDYIDSYVFMDVLSDHLAADDIIVASGAGTSVFIGFQAIRTQAGQRLLHCSGLGAMGASLPESIGACFSRGKQRVICTTGDGSMQLNIQELQTIAHHQLPIKIFVLNNRGYLAIRQTQDIFLAGRHVGVDPDTGVSLPDYTKVAAAYGVPAIRVNNYQELTAHLPGVLASPGPFLVDLMVPPDQPMQARGGFEVGGDGSFKALPLEDMLPRLDRKELLKNMIVKPYGLDSHS